MKILDKKEKNAIAVRVADSKVYISVDKKEEAPYLKYAAHLLNNELGKAVYRLEGSYLFVKLKDDELTFEPRVLADDSEAKFEMDAFFEGRSAEVFDDSDVVTIKLTDKRIFLYAGGVVLAAAIIIYAVLVFTAPKKSNTAKIIMPAAPAVLTEAEKLRLKVMGSRAVAAKLSTIISSIRSDDYARIASLKVQKKEGPNDISYSISTGKEWLYPQVGAVSSKPDVWQKTDSETLSFGRADLKPVNASDFDECALKMLNSGFYTRLRDRKCADFSYEDDAMKIIGAYDSITAGCYVFLNSFEIISDKGKLDVSLCKAE